MPRNYTTKDLTYDQRLALWQSGECPYCGSRKVTENRKAGRNGRHYTCHEDGCGAENYFSRTTAVERSVMA